MLFGSRPGTELDEEELVIMSEADLMGVVVKSTS